MTIAFDPMRDVGGEDPYPVYRRLREEAPVYQAPNTNLFCVSRYEDVLAVLRNADAFSSRAMLTALLNPSKNGRLPLTPATLALAARLIWVARLNPFQMHKHPSLIAADGGRHDSLRAVVNRGFTPHRIAAWQARAREVVGQCIAKLERSEPFDLVEDLSAPLPVTVIAEMLGVDSERRRDFKRWSDALMASMTGLGRGERLRQEHLEAFYDLVSYLARVSRERRRKPAEDLISAIVSRQEGEALRPQDAMQFVILLLVAGNETTTNLIGNAVNALLDHPGELARVAAEPALVPDLVEEVLRWDSPVQLVFRTATRETELAGVRIPKGATVIPLLASANRDGARFPDPDRFDVARRPQGHLAFGFGRHFCLGASLARLEARAALEALVPRLVALRRAESPVSRLDSFMVRGPARLPLVAA